MLMWFMVCLLAAMSPAASAMNSEMTFNLDGFTIDTPVLPQQEQTVQPQAENFFQQSVQPQSFSESSMQFDQGFNASTLFGETLRGSDYILHWNAEATPYITSVSVDGKQVSNDAAIKGNQTVQVMLSIPAGYSITYCEASCLSGTAEESANIEPAGGDTQRSFTTPAGLCSNVNLTITISQSYPITVNGTALTDADGELFLPKGGTVRYFPDNNVLMLSDATADSIEINTPLTLIFTGNNKVDTIHSTAALTISSQSATDQLTVTAPSAPQYSRAIYVEGASLTISSGANVRAQSLGGENLSAGVDVNGYLEVRGTLSAAGGSAVNSYGIRCNTMAVKATGSASGGVVTAAGGDSYSGNSTGIAVSGNAMVEYMANLTAAGKSAFGASRGMSAGGFSVRGTAKFTSGSGWSESTALYCSGDVASWGSLSATGGASSNGPSCGIYASKLSVAGGDLDAHASSGAGGSVGITAAVTVSGGTVLAEGMSSAFSSAPVFTGGYQPLIRVSDLMSAEVEADSSVAANYLKKYVFIRSRNLILTPTELTLRVGESQKLCAAVPNGYTVQWFSSSPNVTVDQLTGTVTGVSAGTAIVTAQAYGSTRAEGDSATCTVTVKGSSTAVTGIHFDQENVSLSTKYGLRTVKYWFSPLGTGGAELTWKCTDATGSIVRFEVSEEEQELYITSVGNGVAVISASAKNGISAYCRVTVSGIGGESSIYIDYIDNSGVWYYDWSDSFTVRCTGTISELLGVYVDGVYIPQMSTAGQRNYTVSDSGGKTLITFTREYMARLSHSVHTLALSYSGYGTLSKRIYIQSIRDAPRTGDVPLAAITAECLFSFASAACCLRKLRKKEH